MPVIFFKIFDVSQSACVLTFLMHNFCHAGMLERLEFRLIIQYTNANMEANGSEAKNKSKWDCHITLTINIKKKWSKML